MTKKKNESKAKKSFESKYDAQKLRELIQAGKSADEIQKELGIVSKQSLRQHVLRLINQDRQFYEVAGLYVRNLKRPMINFKDEVRLTKKMIDFPGTTYKHGDSFEIEADNEKIVLTRISDAPVDQDTPQETGDSDESLESQE